MLNKHSPVSLSLSQCLSSQDEGLRTKRYDRQAGKAKQHCLGLLKPESVSVL